MADVPAGSVSQSPALELDEVMLAMDVVDTLRHQSKLVERELSQEARDEALRVRLREIYESQGLEVTDHILDEGINALKESRFAYDAPPPSFKRFLALMWIKRRTVISALAILIALIVAVIIWQNWQAAAERRSAEERQIELTETLPAALDAAGNAALSAATDFEARAIAERLIAEGKVAVAASNEQAMRGAISGLNELHGNLVQAYQLRIVSRPGEDTGVFRIPDVNEGTRNHYIIVEAITEAGETLSLPIENEENGETESVSKWGIRVPRSTFERIGADKSDDGIVQNNILAEKRRGTLRLDFLMDVADGAITQW